MHVTSKKGNRGTHTFSLLGKHQFIEEWDILKTHGVQFPEPAMLTQHNLLSQGLLGKWAKQRELLRLAVQHYPT